MLGRRLLQTLQREIRSRWSIRVSGGVPIGNDLYLQKQIPLCCRQDALSPRALHDGKKERLI
jgi:hypothetical protein